MRNKQAKFTSLVKALSTDLYRYAFWLCRDKDLAEDLVQETFTRAWRAVDTLRDQKAAKYWLITTLRREHARIYERQQPVFADVDLDTLETSRPDFDTSIEAHLLRLSLHKLPDEYLEPLILQVLWGYSCDEIAGIMELSKGAVMTRLFRARQKLRDMLLEGERSNVRIDGKLYHELS